MTVENVKLNTEEKQLIAYLASMRLIDLKDDLKTNKADLTNVRSQYKKVKDLQIKFVKLLN